MKRAYIHSLGIESCLAMFEFSEHITRCRAQIPMVVWTCFWPLSNVIYWSLMGILIAVKALVVHGTVVVLMDLWWAF